MRHKRSTTATEKKRRAPKSSGKKDARQKKRKKKVQTTPKPRAKPKRKPVKASATDKLKRRYSEKTLKVLFALSYDQCAHPDCANPIIEPATTQSDSVVRAQIAHIYSRSGPRAKPALTQTQLNAAENLILLCRDHHVIADGQHETYTAETLSNWKQSHELKMRQRINLSRVDPDVFAHPYFPRELVDQRIREDTAFLRKGRLYPEFDRVGFSMLLAQRVLPGGELSSGTALARSVALAWCARALSRTPHLPKAEKYLETAALLATTQENEVARAFIASERGDRTAALALLARVDSATGRSAALMVVAHHDGSEAAVKWILDARVSVSSLDSDGKYFLLIQQLQLAEWNDALATADLITQTDFDHTPSLYRSVAMARLLSVVPDDLRSLVANQVLFRAAQIPLASSDVAVEVRRLACEHFGKGAVVERELHCLETAAVDEEFALWLRLRDPTHFDEGRKELQEKLRTVSRLRLVPLALQFGLKLDLAAIEQEIDQKVALHDEIPHDAALARLALALAQKTPIEAANYMERHYDQLLNCTDEKSLRFMQTEILARAGRLDKAKEHLSALVEGGISQADEGRLRNLIAEAEGADPVQVREAQYKANGQLQDLDNLVDALEASQDWVGLCKYGADLFNITRDLATAERLARGLVNAGKPGDLIKFAKANPDLLARSDDLRLMYAWALYEEGSLVEAREEQAKLADRRDSENYRRLSLNLAIALGDWNSISAFVASEYATREGRSSVDLIRAAQLAFYVDSPNAKELMFAAARKGAGDPGILSAAYFLATNGGWESSEEVAGWLRRAAELSGRDGPIQKMTMKDVLDRKPEWDRRTSDVWRLLSRGEVPMFLAAKAFNKSLIELTLFPALANESQRDVRRRAIIPIRSGKRQLSSLDSVNKVGFDATALLTLSFLGVLEKTVDAFSAVLVPHSTLGWIFQEKQRAAFHQPSRITNAHRVRNLLATDALQRFIPTTVADSDLAAEVGDELAALIAEAEHSEAGDTRQRIVVQSSPVHRIGSLMEEEADLTAHGAVLSSCQAIVDKLRALGHLTVEEERNARAYLRLHEKPWATQPHVNDGAILYLDDVSITYFLHLGLLEKLSAAGFTPVVSAAYTSEANFLIAYDGISVKIRSTIDQLRSALSSRIESGKIRVGKRRDSEDSDDRSMIEHPTVGVMSLVDQCDAVIVDDRFLNQHERVEHGGKYVPMFSTLDVIDALAARGAISRENRLEFRTRLRRAGCALVLVDEDEVLTHLNASTVSKSKLLESAELKAIRENLLLVRMTDWLQLPAEAPWLDSVLKAFIRVLKSLWVAGANLEDVAIRSTWILEQIDVRGWVHRLTREAAENAITAGRGLHMVVLLMPPEAASPEIRDAYSRWAEEALLAPIKQESPELYSQLVAFYRKQISETAEMDLKGKDRE